MTHTPGPWVFDEDNMGLDYGPYYGIRTPAVYYSVKIHVGAEGEFTDHDKHDECLANARLVAAAPELLEALTATREVFDTIICFCAEGPELFSREALMKDIEEGAIRALKNVDAAIAKTRREL